jgi:hypothetical protein
MQEGGFFLPFLALCQKKPYFMGPTISIPTYS